MIVPLCKILSVGGMVDLWKEYIKPMRSARLANLDKLPSLRWHVGWQKLHCGLWRGEVHIALFNSSLINERQCFSYTYSIYCYPFQMLTVNVNIVTRTFSLSWGGKAECWQEMLAVTGHQGLLYWMAFDIQEELISGVAGHGEGSPEEASKPGQVWASSGCVGS